MWERRWEEQVDKKKEVVVKGRSGKENSVCQEGHGRRKKSSGEKAVEGRMVREEVESKSG